MGERTITHIPAKPPKVSTIDRPFCVAVYCSVSSTPLGIAMAKYLYKHNHEPIVVWDVFENVQII